MPPLRLYLMTTSCSGKTHFTREHASLCGLPIVDFSKINKAAAAGYHPEALMAPGNSYRERVVAYLQSQTESVCVLGRRGPPDPASIAGVEYAAILVPVEEHIRNWNARRQKRPGTRWTKFSDLESKREKLRSYAEEYCLPIFDSFDSAIEQLVARHAEQGSQI